ncbi:MAG: protein-L-isoaspartate(D-aspartate) O-methyltransferase [Alphaproteobacteria bacterium]|nr:protein-L-isoaspartate(D-aspartate) O-methyltransferase [Alphaproteobacteria bacterium]
MTPTQDANKRIRLVMHLRRMGIADSRVLGAMEKVPRDAFVGPELKHQAWEDTALPIGRGQTISQPYIVALMTQALELKGRETVLEIGTGCGYQTAILAHLCRRIYTIERHKPLLEDAEKRFEALRLRNITAIAGDGMKGWPRINGIEPEPFDRIIVTAAAREKPPQALKDQLKPGGLMVIPVGGSGEQVLKLYRKESEDTFAVRDLAPVRFVPLLPDLAPDKPNGDHAAA